MPRWNQCNQLMGEMKGRRCYLGVDLANSEDLAAVVAVFPPVAPKEPVKVMCWFYIPEDNVHARSRKLGVPMEAWIDQGWIRTTPGNVIDIGKIEYDIAHDIAGQYQIVNLAYDRWGAVQFSQQMQSQGVNVIPWGQGFVDMSEPTKELGRLVASLAFNHGGNPVLAWMAANSMATQDAAGNIKIDRKNSKQKVDGIVATVMGLGAMMRDSVGETRISFLG